MNVYCKIICLSFFCFSIHAGETILMDDETETFLREDIVTPIKNALGYKQEIRVFISTSRVFNACAIQSGDIVINIGAIENCRNVSELIGILAHEVAHIAGNHIATFISSNPDFMKAGLVTMLLGATAAIVAGNPTPFIAGMAGGQHMYRGMALAKMRQKENMADSRSAIAIKRLNWPVLDGFLSIHEKMGSRSDIFNVYDSTHPQASDRIIKFRNWSSEEKQKQFPKDKIELIQKMQRKFMMLKDKIKALALEPTADMMQASNFAQKYALAVFLYRKSHYKEAVCLVDDIMKSEVDDSIDFAYLAEIKSMGLIGLKSYAKAANFAYGFLERARKTRVYRDLGIIYADAVVKGELGKKDYNQAIRILRKILLKDKDEISAYNVLGQVYTLEGRDCDASLCAAEAASLVGDSKMAVIHARKALKSKDEIAKRKASDIISAQTPRA